MWAKFHMISMQYETLPNEQKNYTEHNRKLRQPNKWNLKDSRKLDVSLRLQTKFFHEAGWLIRSFVKSFEQSYLQSFKNSHTYNRVEKSWDQLYLHWPKHAVSGDFNVICEGAERTQTSWRKALERQIDEILPHNHYYNVLGDPNEVVNWPPYKSGKNTGEL